MRLSARVGPLGPLYPIVLWCHAAKHHADDGRLDGYTAAEVEQLVGWTGPAGELVAAMVSLHFIDELPTGGYAIHNWKRHAGHFKTYRLAAKKGAMARWAKHAKPTAPRTAKRSDANRMQTEVPVQGNAGQGNAGQGNPPPKPPASGGAGATDASEVPHLQTLPDNVRGSPIGVAAWAEWTGYLARKARAMHAETAAKLAPDLAEWGPDRLAAAVSHSIKSNWLRLVEPSIGPAPRSTARRAAVTAAIEARQEAPQ